MYIVSQSMLNMTSDEKENFRKVLKSFYKYALYDTEEFETFTSEYNKRKNNKNVNEQINNISYYISEYIKKNDSSLNSFRLRKILNKTSNILAICMVKNSSLLENVKQGGKHNFVYYIELLLAESLTKDNSVKILLQAEQYETLKNIRQMQYYRYNPPDQLFR